jgi:accessory colonization factor AcfC
LLKNQALVVWAQWSPQQPPGTDVMFFVQTTASFYKNMTITLVFEKNANFSPKIVENRRKL